LNPRVHRQEGGCVYSYGMVRFTCISICSRVGIRILSILILGNNQLDALFHIFIYFMSLHVSSVTARIIRRSNCINTSTGMISLCKWLLQTTDWGHCATGQKVAVSINAWIFYCLNPSSRTMALVSNHPLKEMHTSDICWGIQAAGALGWQPCHLHMPIVYKFLEPQPPGAVTTCPDL
jgi:hypothetical protein